MIQPNPHGTNHIAVLRSPHGRDDRFREMDSSAGSFRRPPRRRRSADGWARYAKGGHGRADLDLPHGGPVERLFEMV